MIERLSVKNYKTVKKLNMDCKRINLFIGEPNTGKSNILETLALFSWRSHESSGTGNLNKYVRFEGMQDVFYDGLLEEEVGIFISHSSDNTYTMEIKFTSDVFQVTTKINHTTVITKGQSSILLNYPGEVVNYFTPLRNLAFLKYYRYSKQTKFPTSFSTYLLPPEGSNLFSLAMGNKKIGDLISGLFKERNMTLMLRPAAQTFEVIRQRENVWIGYPYATLSETLQRVIFFLATMESSQESTLVFEEPESSTFPYYTRFLGEKIALDTSNQYFISTHSPYLLFSILEKAPKDAVNVFVTHLKEDRTKIEPLREDQISRLLSLDPFLNIEAFLNGSAE
jgi:AAA15 family ATPase/GTPase